MSRFLRPVVRWLASIRDFIVSVRYELRQVTWPSRARTVRLTVMVIITSIIVGALLFGWDTLLSRGLQYLIT